MTLFNAHLTDRVRFLPLGMMRWLLAFAILSSASYALTSVSSCQNLSVAGETYQLTANISVSGFNCINVTAANVTLDCAGFNITGSNASGKYGVYSTKSNTTVRNCGLRDWDACIDYETGANDGFIINNTFNSTAATNGAIWLQGVNNIFVANNTGYAALYGVAYVFNSDNNQFYNNTANSTNRYAFQFPGGSDNNIVENNTLYSFDWFVIVLHGATANNNNTFRNNTITAGSGTNLTDGISVQVGENNTIDCRGASITGPNTTGTYGVYSAQPNTTIMNCSVSQFEHGITLTSAASSSTVTYNNLTSVVWIENNASSNVFNTSATGNIYYFPNGTASWSVFSIYSTSGGTWANAGASRPFNATTVGANWSGSGSDWFPFTLISTSVSGCQNLSAIGVSYALSQSVSANGTTCFNITAANVSLDCAGYSITGNNSSSAAGINSSGLNSTIRNCRIIFFETGMVLGGNQSTAANNTLIGFNSSSGYENWLAANNTNASNNLNWLSAATRMPTASYGIIANGSNSLIANNTISSFQHGISVYPAVSMGAWADTLATIPSTLGDRPALFAAGDSLYIIGGYTGSAFSNKIYRAPINSPTAWADSGSTTPTALAYLQSPIIIGDYIYMFGGFNTSARSTTILRAPVSNPTSWADTGADLPIGIMSGHTAVIGDYVYLFGGNNGSYTNSILRAPVSNPLSWSVTGSTIPDTIGVGTVVVIGDYVYLLGGYSSAVLNTIYRAPVSNPLSWSNTSATLPVALWASHAAIIDDYVYLLGGGTSATTYTNVVYRAPLSNPTAWADSGITLPSNLGFALNYVGNGRAYTLGGETANAVYTNKIYSSPIYLYNNSGTSVINNTISSSGTGNSTAIWMRGLSGTITNNTVQAATTAYVSDYANTTVFRGNNVTASVWHDEWGNRTNYYNSSFAGNIYYFASGTASWDVLDITATSSPGWADAGSARPLNATTASGYWKGNGQDWFPWTETVTSGTMTIGYPLNYTIVQRFNSTTGEIRIVGTYTSAPTAIEASFNGGAFQTINASPSGGAFSGALNASVGQGSLTVRFTNSHATNATTYNVSIGDLYVAYGQSNSIGAGVNLTSSSTGLLYYPVVFDSFSAKKWKFAQDPFSIDWGMGNGSVYPTLGNYLVGNFSVPVGFMSVGWGGQQIAGLMPGSSNWTRAVADIDRATNGTRKIKAFLYLQGESDTPNGSTVNGVYATWYSNISTMANAVNSTFNATMMVASLGGYADAGTRTKLDNVRRAQQDTWLAGGNFTRFGPLTYDIAHLLNTNHFETDNEMKALARRWYYSIGEAFYNLSGTTAPNITAVYRVNNTTIRLVWNNSIAITKWEGTSSSLAKGIFVMDGASNLTDANVSSTNISGSTIDFNFNCTAGLGSTLYVWYGSFNDAVDQPVITGTTSYLIPARPFYNMTAGAVPSPSSNITVSAISAVPSSPSKSTNLSCNVTITGPNSDYNVSYEWYKNGANQSALAGSIIGVLNNTASLVSNLTAGNFTKNENWSCRVNATNGSVQTGWNMSANVTIANSAPAIASAISFTNASTGHWFYANATASDADGSADIASWNVSASSGSCANYSNSTSGNNLTVIFNCSGTALQSATVNITFIDSSAASASTSGSNSYPNNAPTSPAGLLPNGGETFSDSAANNISINWTNSTDADGDSITYWLYYSSDGGATYSLIANTTSNPYGWNSTALSSGSGYRVRVYANDSYNVSANVSSSANFTIAHNTPPIISALAVAPSSPTELSNLTCNITVTDGENATLTIYYNWTKNGANQPALNGSTAASNNTSTLISTLLSGNLSVSDKWACAAIASDLQSNSSLNYTSNVTVLNSSAISSCQNLSASNTIYTLGQNISVVDATCFNVTAAGVTLDCAGYRINGSNMTDTYGVYSNQSRTTVRNCIISNFSSEIYLNGASNAVITNNTLNNSFRQGYSLIAIGGARNLTMTSNSVSRSRLGYGIYIEEDTDNATVDCRGAAMAGDTGAYAYGVFSAGNRTTIKNCVLVEFAESIRINGGRDLTVQNNSLNATAWPAHVALGIVLSSGGMIGVRNALIENNTLNISSRAGGTATIGINFDAGATYSHNNVTVRNNTIVQYGSDSATGIGVGTSAPNASIVRNNITADVWVADSAIDSSGVNFNDSAAGNIYYFPNGTGAWEVFNITDSNNDSWADAGSGRPFNSTNAGGNWTGAGADWHPFTLTANPAPVIVQNVSFVNSSTTASFLASATASDTDGAANITSWNISTTSGACVNYSNSTSGNNLTVTFNCTGTASQSATVNITFIDSTGLYVSTNGTNAYPDNSESPPPPASSPSSSPPSGGGPVTPRPARPAVTPPVQPSQPSGGQPEQPATPPVTPPVQPSQPPVQPPEQPSTIPIKRPAAGEPAPLVPEAGEASSDPLTRLIKALSSMAAPAVAVASPFWPLLAILLLTAIIAAAVAMLVWRRGGKK